MRSRRAGGYDESFSANEDAELDIRLRQLGFKIWLTGGTSIVYYPRSSAGSLFRQYVNWGTGRARTVLKHHTRLETPPAVARRRPADGSDRAGRSDRAMRRRCRSRPGRRFASCMDCIWPSRGRDLGALAAGPAAMIMHMGYSIGFWRAVVRQFLDPRSLMEKNLETQGVGDFRAPGV